MAWTVCVAASLYWNISHAKHQTFNSAKATAAVAFEKDIIYRSWNAKHGGVYALVTEETTPNPYLETEERDIQTPSGKKLTKINPAYMTRQIHEIGKSESGIIGHITSLNPIRPKNSPDAWEAEALKKFQEGVGEVSEIRHMEGGLYLRLIRPLIVKENCLQCHAKQGYKLNDIRGGISVSVPMKPMLKLERQFITTISMAHALLWALGILGIIFSNTKLQQQNRRRIKMEEELFESEERYKQLFKSAGEAIFLMEDEKFIECNPQTLKLFKCAEGDIIGNRPDQFSPPEQPDGRDSKEKASEKMNLAYEGNTQVFEWLHKRFTGEHFYAEVTLNRILLKGKAYLQAIVRDISHRKELETEQKRHERLQGALETAGAVCHELSQPIQAISGNFELIKMKIEDDSPYLQKIENIQTQIDRVGEITKKLMRITKYQTRRYLDGEIIDIDKSSD